MQPRYFAGQARTDGTVIVAYLETEAAAGLAADCFARRVEHRLGQFTLVERLVAWFRAELGNVFGESRVGNDR